MASYHRSWSWVSTSFVLLLACLGVPAAGQVVASGVDGDSAAAATRAARLLVGSLDEAQRSRALHPLAGDERFELRLAPLPPWGGLPLGEMELTQVVLLHQLLGASLSAQGFAKVTGIVALEDFLVRDERARGRVVPVHGIERYSLAVFGDPQPGDTWGWRLQGHHLSVNFLVTPQGVTASAPAFLGAQPHRLEQGPNAGWRVLAAEEDRGRAVLAVLDDSQRSRARLAAEMPRDMFAGAHREYDLGEPRGVAFGELRPEAQTRLRELVDEFVANVRGGAAERRRAAVERGGWQAVRFAFIGGESAEDRLYYRVHGPEFLLEYCAVAQSPNHVHTIWRERDGDFGRDLLAEHMRASEH
jgi:hypothetical protein